MRERLRVPSDAPRVMVVTESTHWDPNWLCTSVEYFRWRVRRCLDLAIDALVADPRRVFSLECVFFLDLYWEARPERRHLFRALVNEGRLRFTGSGVTTPDTLLPDDELLLRDLLIGQEWIRARDMTQEPRVLYLPDSFGHSPALPSLLAAAGVGGVALTRIDGMRFPGADMESAAAFPRPATSAADLIAERTADFVWRGPDGSEVLAHWLTYGYGHGDMIASGGLSRALGLPVSWPDRRERRVAARIDRYIDDLSRVARTPYLLLALGLDFVAPVPRLVDLLDRWNDTEYQRTGVWLVNAGMDDYLDLVSTHRHLLPTIPFDPNPYWMGFYATRPGVKARCRTLGRALVAADNDVARASIASASASASTPTATAALHAASRDRAWWRAVSSNHHDFVTGTSPDRVANGEQTRWLDEAFADLATFTGRSPTTDPHPRPSHSGHRPLVDQPAHEPVDRSDEQANGSIPVSPSERTSWTRQGHLVTVCTPTLTAVFDEHRGGTLVRLTDATGNELISAPSLDLRSYAESGGLWRMGHEFRGGRWALADESSRHPARVSVGRGENGGVQVTIRALLDVRPVEVTVDLSGTDPDLLVHTSVTAPRRRTVALAVRGMDQIADLLMHQPGGIVARDLERWYDPTFWPLHSFAATRRVDPNEPTSRNADSGETPVAVTAATATPTALHATPDGVVEVVVARTAIKEMAFGAIPVMAPAWGLRWGTQDAALAWSWSPASSTAEVSTIGRRLVAALDRAVGRSVPDWLVDTGDPLAEVLAVKVADRGDGIIVRIRSWADPASLQHVDLALAPTNEDEGEGRGEGEVQVIEAAWLADALERDLEALVVRDGVVRLGLHAHITTVRLAVGKATAVPSTVAVPD